MAWIGIVIVMVSVLAWFNNQTASLTDVIDQEQPSGADMVLQQTQNGTQILSTVKNYENLHGATLRMSFFVPAWQEQAFEESIQSSYWFFVTNHHNTSIVTLYLPERIDENTELLTIHGWSDSIVDTIVLFQGEEMDDIRLEQKVIGDSHW